VGDKKGKNGSGQKGQQNEMQEGKEKAGSQRKIIAMKCWGGEIFNCVSRKTDGGRTRKINYARGGSRDGALSLGAGRRTMKERRG